MTCAVRTRSPMSDARRAAAASFVVVTMAAAGCVPARAQGKPGGPPSVGVIKVEMKPITESNEFIGRIEAIGKVSIVARVTAYLEKVDFVDGAEVKKGGLLYELERSPFQADLDAKKAVADQYEAQLTNATLAEQRASALLKTNAGAQSTLDAATASQKALSAQLLGARSSVQTSQINLDYTRIAAPIDGKLGFTRITPGNVVSGSSGTLVTLVSQDPMYVSLPGGGAHAAPAARQIRAGNGGFDAVTIKVRLPNGKVYKQAGKLNFVDNTVQTGTDTIVLRGNIPNPTLDIPDSTGRIRELYDNEFVTVMLEGVKPVEAMAIPRSAVLLDQQGDYVYVVGADNKATRRDVKLGTSTPAVAAVTSGLKVGEMIVMEGVQRVKNGAAVTPQLPTPQPTARRPIPSRPITSRPARRRPEAAGRETAMFSSIFVDRPRLAIVIAIVITLAGALALQAIPLSQFPDIVPPQVQVTANYPGASAQVVEQAVAQPIEAQVVGVDKSIYMKSVSGNDGSYTLTVSFALGTNPDIDTVNVNNRVQTAQSQLPAQVTLQGLTVQKRSSAVLQFMMLYSDNGKQDPLFITNYAVINVLDEISRTPGVGQALAVRQAQLFDADLVRHPAADERSIWRRPTSSPRSTSQNNQAAIGRIGARAGPRRTSSTSSISRPTGSPHDRRAVRRHRAARQSPTAPISRSRTSPGSSSGRRTRTPRARYPGKPAVAIGIYLSRRAPMPFPPPTAVNKTLANELKPAVSRRD